MFMLKVIALNDKTLEHGTYLHAYNGPTFYRI